MSDKLWYEFYPDEESIEEFHDRRMMTCPILDAAERDVLRQLREVTWDGNLVSKTARGSLVAKGLAVRYNGFQVVSQQGLALLETMGELREWDKPRNMRSKP